MKSHGDFDWEDAEKLMRDNGRRTLMGGSRVSNEAIMGEVGWMKMLGRRMLLRLTYWGKILTNGQRQTDEAGV